MNTTGIIGQIILLGSANVSGSMEATLYIILIFIIAVALLFQIPLEYLVVIVFPYCLICGAYYSFTIPIIIMIAYTSMIIAKNFFLR